MSEMGDGRIQHPRDVLQEGDVVQARIIRIDPARKRIGLSTRQSSDDQSTRQSSDDEESDVGE